MMDAKTREKLMTVSCATLCTALYKRGLRNQFIQDVRPLSSAGNNMVGPAFTLRYILAREDLNPLEVFRNPEHPQRAAVEACPAGAVLIMDSRKDTRAASAGGILVSRLLKRGVAGVVTDGGFRDNPEIAELLRRFIGFDALQVFCFPALIIIGWRVWNVSVRSSCKICG